MKKIVLSIAIPFFNGFETVVSILNELGGSIELNYEILQGGNGGSNVRFSWFAVNENRDIDYCIQVMNSHDMFGCVGLRKKGFYIFRA